VSASSTTAIPGPVLEALVQAALALAYYASLVTLMRLAGKRLAGQVTTFDLVVLITLGVVLQSTALRPGRWCGTAGSPSRRWRTRA
jgi:hypothetical protein